MGEKTGSLDTGSSEEAQRQARRARRLATLDSKLGLTAFGTVFEAAVVQILTLPLSHHGYLSGASSFFFFFFKIDIIF